MSHTVESRRMRGSRGCDDVKHKKRQKSSRSPQKSLRNRFAIRHAVGLRGAHVSLQKFAVVIGKVSFQHDSFSLRFVPRLLICRKRTCYELLFKPENSIGIKIKPEFIGAMKKLLYKFFFSFSVRLLGAEESESFSCTYALPSYFVFVFVAKLNRPKNERKTFAVTSN